MRRAVTYLMVVLALLIGSAVGISIGRSEVTPMNALDVWIAPQAPSAEVRSIEHSVLSNGSFSDCIYWSQQRDYAQAKKLLKASVSSVLTVANVPSSFRCHGSSAAKIGSFLRNLKHQEGVFEVTNAPLVDVPRS